MIFMIKKLNEIMSSTGKALLNLLARSALLWLILNHYGLWGKIVSGVFPATANVVDWFGLCISVVVILSLFRQPPRVVNQTPQVQQPPVIIQMLLEVEEYLTGTSLGEKVEYTLSRHKDGWTFSVDNEDWVKAGNEQFFYGEFPEECMENFFNYINSHKIDGKTLKKNT